MRFVERLKPSYSPPSRFRIANSLLDDAHARVKDRMDAILAQSAGQITLTSDSWTNLRSESLINYVVTTRQHAIYLKSEPSGSERHDGPMLARGLIDTIEELGGSKAVVAVTTDNASNMKASWDLLEQRFPGLLTIGCASHIINLTVNELLRVSDIQLLLHQVIEFIRYFKKSTLLSPALRAAIPRDAAIPSLKLPGKTRWQGKYDAVHSLIANRPYLVQVLEDPSTCLGPHPTLASRAKYHEIEAHAHSWRFWELVGALKLFLKPFLQATIALESTKPRASRVYAYFQHLANRASFTTTLPRDEICEVIGRRWAQVHRPIYTVAYICDISARIERHVEITEARRVEMARWLEQRYTEPGRASAIYKELLDVVDREGSYANKIVWESFFDYPDPAGWWRKRDCSNDLKSLAIYALSINPTTGAAERNWSAHGYLHNQHRNRLTNPRVQKLVYVFQNSRVREENMKETTSYFSPEEVDESSDDEVENTSTIALLENSAQDEPIPDGTVALVDGTITPTS